MSRLIARGLVLCALIFAYGVGALTASTAVRANSDEAIVATEFRLQDESGHIRARLGTGATGGPTLEMFDRNEAQRFALTLSDDGNLSLVGCDAKEAARMVCGVAREGDPFVSLRAADGTPRITLTVTHSGNPSVTMYSGNGERIAVQLPTADELQAK